ncbi:MAG: phosphoserine phosphatase SerB [Proteobacteria bacterium]|nr:phosphoserine phosphatase SerB [Pseudomonadota bacterium]
MSFVLTLAASEKPLTPAHLSVLQRYAELQGLGPDAWEWLAPHRAAQMKTAGRANRAQMEAIRDSLRADRIDVFIAPAENRRKKLLLSDMDATIVIGETLDELAAEAGIGEKISAITARAMRGEIEFRDALRERVAALKGLPAGMMKTVLDKTELSPGAKILIRTMAHHGALCVLVSGGFTFFTGEVAKQCGFHHYHGNVLEIEDGRLTGTVAEPILDKDAKRGFLVDYAAKAGLSLAQTMAVGDGANDLPMLAAAGLGFGWRPKPLLRESLDNCILYGDLTAALYAQGYHAGEFKHGD